MASTTFSELLALGLKQARDTYRLFPKQPKLPSCVYGVINRNIIDFYKLHMFDPMSRAIGHAGATHMLRRSGSDASLFVAEMWVGDKALGDQRQEIVIVVASTADGFAVACYAMKRDKKGRLSVGKKLDADYSGGGLMWDFFAAQRLQKHTVN